MDDNEELLGKSPDVDGKVFQVIRNRHIERLKALKYSNEEIKQCLPSYLKGETLPSLRNALMQRILDKQIILTKSQLSSLPKDVHQNLKALDPTTSKNTQQSVIQSSPLSPFQAAQFQSLLQTIEGKNEDESFQLDGNQRERELGFIVAYGSSEKVKNTFQGVHPIILNTEQIPVDVHSSGFMTYLQMAIATDNFINFQYLLDSGANSSSDIPGDNLWHYVFSAASKSFIKVLFHLNNQKGLFLQEIDFNAQNRDGETPLHLAARNGRSAEIKVLFQKLIELQGEKFLKRIDLNAKNNQNESALHIALTGQHDEMVKYLILQGADINKQDNRGNTPLHLALTRENDEMAKWLILQGANLNIQDNQGLTPLYYIYGGDETDFQMLLPPHYALLPLVPEQTNISLFQKILRSTNDRGRWWIINLAMILAGIDLIGVRVLIFIGVCIAVAFGVVIAMAGIGLLVSIGIGTGGATFLIPALIWTVVGTLSLIALHHASWKLLSTQVQTYYFLIDKVKSVGHAITSAFHFLTLGIFSKNEREISSRNTYQSLNEPLEKDKFQLEENEPQEGSSYSLVSEQEENMEMKKVFPSVFHSDSPKDENSSLITPRYKRTDKGKEVVEDPEEEDQKNNYSDLKNVD